MSEKRIPQTDSIRELAKFWDTHDPTDFEDQLEEVTEPAFERETVLQIHLPAQQAEAIEELAKFKSMDSADLIREWVLEKMGAT